MRRILVTGANKGIGHAIVKAILDEHADTFVYLGSRDAARGAASDLPKDRVAVLALDVSKAFTAPPVEELYAIVNNAGIGTGNPLKDILETNVYGVKRVVDAYLGKLAENGRIVNVTSASGPTYVSSAAADEKTLLLDPKIEWPELDAFMKKQLEKGNTEAYGLSKACANAYTVMLARANPQLHINACTPGFIETDMTRHYAESQKKSAADLGMKPPSAGARAPMHLLFGNLEGNGRYYGSDAKRSPLDRYRGPGTPEYTGD
jgi:NAD(P)-dependent dehydrogenase (short-subunit alcohol dehydrogenase family)